MRSLNLSASLPPEGIPFDMFQRPNSGTKALLVVAHPDDESECAGFLYRMTHEFGAIADQIVVTNGEGGFEYSAPAKAFYNCNANEDAWRTQLAQIRRQELLGAGKVLGIRRFYFLEQTDTGFTDSADNGFRDWNTAWIRQELFRLFLRERYDVVVLLLPTNDTHGHHKTIALLTLEVVAALSAKDRPATLGVKALAAESDAPNDYFGLSGYPLTVTAGSEPVWVFDRRKPLHCHRALDYSIIANWVIAEHKSQGAFQMEFSRRTRECFWLFTVSADSGAARWRKLMRRFEPDASDCRFVSVPAQSQMA